MYFRFLSNFQTKQRCGLCKRAKFELQKLYLGTSLPLPTLNAQELSDSLIEHTRLVDYEKYLSFKNIKNFSQKIWSISSYKYSPFDFF